MPFKVIQRLWLFIGAKVGASAVRNGTAIDWLDGTCHAPSIVHAGHAAARIHIGKQDTLHSVQLLFADNHWLISHEPRHGFGAGRFRQRSIVAVKVNGRDQLGMVRIPHGAWFELLLRRKNQCSINSVQCCTRNGFKGRETAIRRRQIVASLSKGLQAKLLIIVVFTLKAVERFIKVVVVAFRRRLGLDQHGPNNDATSQRVKVKHLHFRGKGLSFDLVLGRNFDINRKKIRQHEPTIWEITRGWRRILAHFIVGARASRIDELELVAQDILFDFIAGKRIVSS